MKRLILLCCILVLVLNACAVDGMPPSESSEPTLRSTTVPESTTDPTEEENTEEPIPAQTWEPSYYDAYGIKYVLVEGSDGEYVIDETYWENIETPDSSALTEIAYWPYGKELRVQFRNSGAWYTYYDVPVEIWQDFKNAESKGRYYNQYIKGSYECTKD